MGDVVNLQHYRKQQKRRRKADQGAANRVRHGVAKKVKARTQSERERRDRELDGKRLVEDDRGDDTPASS